MDDFQQTILLSQCNTRVLMERGARASFKRPFSAACAAILPCRLTIPVSVYSWMKITHSKLKLQQFLFFGECSNFDAMSRTQPLTEVYSFSIFLINNP